MKVGSLMHRPGASINSKFEYRIKLQFEFCIIYFKSGLLKLLQGTVERVSLERIISIHRLKETKHHRG